MREITDGSAKFRVVDKRMKAMIDILYPIGIIVTTATDDAIKPGEADGLAQWEEIAQDKVLQGTSSGAGVTIEAGLPNITGSIIGYSDRTGFGGADGMAYMDDMQERIPSMGDIFPGNKSALRVRLDASKSNNIYGKSSTVQPPAYIIRRCTMERNDGEKITMQFVERMAKMEEKLDMLVRMLPEITALQIAQARSEQTAASAHNRIDNIYKVAGLISTIISVVIALIGRAV